MFHEKWCLKAVRPFFGTSFDTKVLGEWHLKVEGGFNMALFIHKDGYCWVEIVLV